MKEEIRKALIEILRERLEQALGSFEAEREAMNDSPTRNESRYDSLRSEHGAIAATIKQDLVNIEKSLRKREDEGTGKVVVTDHQTYGVYSGGQGDKIVISGKEIVIVSPESPIGQMLAKAKVGDNVQIGNKFCRVLEIL